MLWGIEGRLVQASRSDEKVGRTSVVSAKRACAPVCVLVGLHALVDAQRRALLAGEGLISLNEGQRGKVYDVGGEGC